MSLFVAICIDRFWRVITFMRFIVRNFLFLIDKYLIIRRNWQFKGIRVLLIVKRKNRVYKIVIFLSFKIFKLYILSFRSGFLNFYHKFIQPFWLHTCFPFKFGNSTAQVCQLVKILAKNKIKAQRSCQTWQLKQTVVVIMIIIIKHIFTAQYP